MRTLVIGCGDMGRRVARLETTAGNVVSGMVRSLESAQRLRSEAVEAMILDLDKPESLENLPVRGVIVYYFAPPPGTGGTDPRMQSFVSVLTPSNLPARVIYISTTGVYGDCGGEWVTEDRPPAPQTDRGRRRLAAENTLRRWSEKTEVPVVILRVPGIYAADRLPQARLRAGEPVLREEESPYSNRIHADDLAQICFTAGHRASPGSMYNVSDGHPTTMTDYFFRVADALGIPRPPALTREQACRQLGEGMRSYLGESKRIDNRRMLAELGVKLRYPDLAAGLRECRKSRG